MKIEQLLNLISRHLVHNPISTDDHIKLLSILGTINNEGRQKLDSAVKLIKNNDNVDLLQNSVNHEAMVPFVQPNGQWSDETHLEPSQPKRNLQSERLSNICSVCTT